MSEPIKYSLDDLKKLRDQHLKSFKPERPFDLNYSSIGIEYSYYTSLFLDWVKYQESKGNILNLLK